MRSTSLNFARWLDRLGIKTPVQPTLFESVQPVAIVGDHRFLVSPALNAAGCVGTSQVTGAANFGCLQVKTSTPLAMFFTIGSGGARAVSFEIGPVATAPALLASTVLTPQPYTLDPPQQFRSTWVVGEVAAARPATLPAIRLTNQINSIPLTEPVFVPAGAYAQFTADSNGAGGILTFMVSFFEMPGEMAQ